MDGRSGTPAEGTKKIRVSGVVKEVLPNALYRCELDSGETVLAHASSKFRLHAVRVLPESRVKLEISPYDLSRGRIVG